MLLTKRITGVDDIQYEAACTLAKIHVEQVDIL